MRFLEVFNHLPNVCFDIWHLWFNCFNLTFFIILHGNIIFNILSESSSACFFFIIGHFSKLLVSFDFHLDVFILIFDGINLRVKSVNVVVKSVVLVVSLDESGNDFISGGDTGLLFNLVESIFDNAYISNVNIHKVLLLFIFADMFGESHFHDLDWVREFSGWACVLLSIIGSMRFGDTEFSFIFLSKFILHQLNSLFEISFFSLVLSFNGQDRVVSLLRNSLSLESSLIQFSSFIVGNLDIFVVSSVNSILIILFFSHDINLMSECSIFSLEIIEVF